MILSFYRNDSSFDVEIVKNLTKMLDEFNVHAKSFRMARDSYEVLVSRSGMTKQWSKIKRGGGELDF